MNLRVSRSMMVGLLLLGGMFSSNVFAATSILLIASDHANDSVNTSLISNEANPSAIEGVNDVPLQQAQNDQTVIEWNFHDLDHDGLNDSVSIIPTITLNSSLNVTMTMLVDIYSIVTANQSLILVAETRETFMTYQGNAYYYLLWKATASSDYRINITIFSNETSYWYSESREWLGAHVYSPPPGLYYWDFMDDDQDGVPDTSRLTAYLYINSTSGFWTNFTASNDMTANLLFEISISVLNDTLVNGTTQWLHYNTIFKNASVPVYNGVAVDTWQWQAPFNGTFKFDITVRVNGSLHDVFSKTWTDADGYQNGTTTPTTNQLYSYWYDGDSDGNGLRDQVVASFTLTLNTTSSIAVSMNVTVSYFINGSWVYFEEYWTEKYSQNGYVGFWFQWNAPQSGDVMFKVNFYWNGGSKPFLNETRTYLNVERISLPSTYQGTYSSDMNQDGLDDLLETSFDVLLFLDNKTGFLSQSTGENHSITVFTDVYYFSTSNNNWTYLETISKSYLLDSRLDFVIFWYQPTFNASFRFEINYQVNGTSFFSVTIEWMNAFWLPPITTHGTYLDSDGDYLEDTANLNIYFRLQAETGGIFSNASSQIQEKHATVEIKIEIFYLNSTDPNDQQWTFYQSVDEVFNSSYWLYHSWWKEFRWSAPFPGTFRFNITVLVDGTMRGMDWHVWSAPDGKDQVEDFWINDYWFVDDADLDGYHDTVSADLGIGSNLPDSPLSLTLRINIYYINETSPTNGTPSLKTLVDVIERSVVLDNGYAWEWFRWQPSIAGDFMIEILLLNANGTSKLTSVEKIWHDLHPPLFPNFWLVDYQFTRDLDRDSLPDTAVLGYYMTATNVTARFELSIQVTIFDAATNESVDQMITGATIEFNGGVNETQVIEIPWPASRDGSFVFEVLMTYRDTGELFRHFHHTITGLHQYWGNTTTTVVTSDTTPITNTTIDSTATVITPGLTVLAVVSVGIASLMTVHQRRLQKRKYSK